MRRRFGMIVMTKNSPRQRRINLDLKQSLVTNATAKTHRVVVPRVTDVVVDALELMETQDHDSPQLNHWFSTLWMLFGRYRDPWFCVIYVFTLIPVHGLRACIYAVLLLMLLFPGP